METYPAFCIHIKGNSPAPITEIVWILNGYNLTDNIFCLFCHIMNRVVNL